MSVEARFDLKSYDPESSRGHSFMASTSILETVHLTLCCPLHLLGLCLNRVLGDLLSFFATLHAQFEHHATATLSDVKFRRKSKIARGLSKLSNCEQQSQRTICDDSVAPLREEESSLPLLAPLHDQKRISVEVGFGLNSYGPNNPRAIALWLAPRQLWLTLCCPLHLWVSA
jgi:hypothetical protein